jgi:ATP/maltotriose-dependent transcriptional regulator MalT/DNA-binding SARP family transcriptional activator
MHATRQTRLSASPTWKFQPPRLGPALLPRPHLIARLDQFLGRKQAGGTVFLLSAPAGFGKSTLLGQWAEETSVPVAWYSPDASDDDPAVLLMGLAEALRRQLPRAEWEFMRVLERAASEALSPADTRRAVAVLARDIQRNVSRPLALVLSGLAGLQANSPALAVLNGLLARPADQLRIIIETREPPRLRLAHLLTQRRVEGLGAEDLRLRGDELEPLLERIGVAADGEYVERLRVLCGGWLAGVLLASGALLPDFMAQGIVTEFDSERVFDYLAAEIIEQLPVSLRAFAEEASVMSYMTAPLCANLLELTDARERLAALERRTGFVTRTGRRPEEPVYRFQPLLREALLERLASGPKGEERRRQLHVRAGMLFEAIGDGDEALKQYTQAGEYERAAAMIETQRDTLLRSARGATLARWIGLLPPVFLQTRPSLHVLLAEMHRQAGRLDDAQAHVNRACQTLLPAAATYPQEAARALHTRAAIAFVRGRYADARADCEAALRVLGEEAGELCVRIGLTLAVCVAALEGPAQALAHLAALEELSARQRDPWALGRLHYFRSSQLTVQGAFAEAEAAATFALRAFQEANAEVDAIASRLNLGHALLLQGHVTQAREHFEIAQANAEAASYLPGQAYALLNLGNLELNAEQYARAEVAYAEAERLARQIEDSRLLAFVQGGRGYTLVLAGRTTDAHELLAAALSTHDTPGYGDASAGLMIALGFAHLRAGDPEAAAVTLRAARERACDCGAHEKLASARIHLAAAELALGHQRAAEELLLSALEAAAVGDGEAVLRQEVRALPELRPLLATLSRSHPLAAALCADAGPAAQHGGEHDDQPREMAEEQIRVFALGESRVLIGTERISRWRMPHARELLYFLLDRGEPVRKETILEAFWPDKDPEVSENTLRQARFRLKAALGRDCLVQENGRWRLTVDCWLDVRGFERLVDEGERLAANGELSAAASALAEAATYWRGDYLEDCYSDWAVLRRDELRQRHLAALEQLAEIESRLGRYDEAARTCHRILSVDPMHESAHRHLMRHFQRRGELAQAIHQFARCYNALKQELGVAPSRETVELYRAIRSRLETAPPEHAPRLGPESFSRTDSHRLVRQTR